MSEDIDVYFVGEVIVANGLKEVGPVVIELEIIDFGVFMEEAAVIGWDIFVDISFINASEEVKKVLPSGIYDSLEWRDFFPSIFK